MTAKKLGIIGGTTLKNIGSLQQCEEHVISTSYGDPSSVLISGSLQGVKLYSLARHGENHTIPPHQINYRANLWAFKMLGVTDILAFATAGGINKDMRPGALVVPDQIIDYTYARDHTYFESEFNIEQHIDFTEPYSKDLRGCLLQAAGRSGIKVIDGATYGATQGPRLETAAEIRRLQQDGCDIVGMTGMPEAALARELGLNYACCATVVNWAAGLSQQAISIDEIKTVISEANDSLMSLLEAICAGF